MSVALASTMVGLGSVAYLAVGLPISRRVFRFVDERPTSPIYTDQAEVSALIALFLWPLALVAIGLTVAYGRLERYWQAPSKTPGR